MPVIAVLGVGPGLGGSIARRFKTEGYEVAVVSRSTARHAPYGGDRSYPADLTDPTAVHDVIGRIRRDLGRIDTVYFGPATGGADGIVPLPEAGAAAVRAPLEAVLTPAVTTVAEVLPEMLERGDGALLFAGGLSGLRPMAMLGNLAPASAALRMYVLTLHEALAPLGVYAGIVTIGGLVARGDIHTMFKDRPGGADLPTLDPDELAAAAWRMATDRKPAESVFEKMPF